MVGSIQASPKRLKELDQLSGRLGVTFGRMALLNEALTHSSFAAEHPGTRDYERLEFFGDAILKFVISEYLLERFPDYNEGQLTEIRSVLVSDKTLAGLAQEMNLSIYILLGKQVQMRPSIMAQSLEAVIGAVYVDLGLIHVQNLVVRMFGNQATNIDRDDVKDNFKAELQEITQANAQGVPHYTVIRQEGPAHDPTFHVYVSVEGKKIAAGSGPSKKAAEQDAARAALAELAKAEKPLTKNRKPSLPTQEPAQEQAQEAAPAPTQGPEAAPDAG